VVKARCGKEAEGGGKDSTWGYHFQKGELSSGKNGSASKNNWLGKKKKEKVKEVVGTSVVEPFHPLQTGVIFREKGMRHWLMS